MFPPSDIHEKSAEIGYWLSGKYWGNGIMPRAIAEIVEYGFNSFDITFYLIIVLWSGMDRPYFTIKSIRKLKTTNKRNR
ncbi:GNAT family N-acetyltransferase [Bacteroides xylanisolvens]|uniref:GNAT family N-acetyltransferase n=1 Tax=Bacteroides xylanisolvens TaxID=371601 RepID=UPI0039B6B177